MRVILSRKFQNKQQPCSLRIYSRELFPDTLFLHVKPPFLVPKRLTSEEMKAIETLCKIYHT